MQEGGGSALTERIRSTRRGALKGGVMTESASFNEKRRRKTGRASSFKDYFCAPGFWRGTDPKYVRRGGKVSLPVHGMLVGANRGKKGHLLDFFWRKGSGGHGGCCACEEGTVRTEKRIFFQQEEEGQDGSEEWVGGRSRRLGGVSGGKKESYLLVA